MVHVRLPVPAEEAWALVTDVRNHARWVPLTRVDAARELGVGDRFTAVTGPRARRGGAGLQDRMVVERLVPPTAGRPGRVRYRKLGPVLLGTAEVGVRSDGEHAELEWIEDVHVRGLPRGATAWFVRPLLGLMLRVVVRRLQSELRLPAEG